MTEAAMSIESSADDTHEFLAFAADSETSQILMQAAAQAGLDDTAVVPLRNGVAECFSELSHVATPNILVVDFSESEDLFADLASLAEVCDPGGRVIVIGQVNDINVYRMLKKAGVHEYLVKPLVLENVAEAIRRRHVEDTPQEAPQKKSTCKVIAALGVHGGSGATTVAVNSACALSSEYGQRVAIVDLDLTFGTVALALDIEPGKGLVDALTNPSRIDELFMKRALTPCGENMAVLASEADPSRLVSADPAAIGVLIDNLRREFDAIILDMPRDLLVNEPAYLSLIDEIMLVSEPSLVGMRDTVRLATLIAERNASLVRKVVLNRTGLTPKGELTAELFIKNTDLGVVGEVPFDAKAAANAARKGKAMVLADKQAKASAMLRTIAASFLNPEEGEAPSSLWKRLTKRGK